MYPSPFVLSMQAEEEYPDGWEFVEEGEEVSIIALQID